MINEDESFIYSNGTNFNSFNDNSFILNFGIDFSSIEFENQARSGCIGSNIDYWMHVYFMFHKLKIFWHLNFH